MPSTTKKLVMPEGVKLLDKGCILTAGYLYPSAEKIRPFRQKSSRKRHVVVLYLLIEADVSMETGNRIRLLRRQRVPAIFLQGSSTKGLLQLQC